MPSSFELRQARLNTQENVCYRRTKYMNMAPKKNPATNNRELKTTSLGTQMKWWTDELHYKTK